MFGIYLTTMQKLEIAFICVILAIAGVFVFQSTRPTFNRTVTSFTLPVKHHPLNDNPQKTAPITALNPMDPKKDELTTVFACADGQLQILEFPNDPSKHPQLKWLPETRQPGLVYQYYQNPMGPVDLIKDPFRHALAYATYNTFYGRALHLLANVGLTDAQISQEGAAREAMNNEIKIINSSIEEGGYQPKLMDEVMKAFAAYSAKSGDPQKDAVKSDLAHKVLEAVAAFEKAVEADKNKAIEKYMNVLDKALTADQKQKLIDAYRNATQPAPTRPPVVNRAPAPGAGTAPARGGATRAGAGRGATTRGGTRGTTVPAGG